MTPLGRRLLALIDREGPLPVSQVMAACLFDPREGYYATRPRLGADFITAPEISQMFGELIGLWAVQTWRELGEPTPFLLVELGPGRGTLMRDAWRAARVAPEFRAAARLTLVEASEPLAAAQAATLARVGARPRHVRRLEEASNLPMILIANEFLDCLPIRQFVRTQDGWRERLVGRDPDGADALVFRLAAEPLPDNAVIPPALVDAPEGALAEIRPAIEGLVDHVAQRLQRHPGRALFIDYGPAASEPGDTLQAIKDGRRIEALAAPGESDLSARVDFSALRRFARASGLEVAGPKGQGAWLEDLGLSARALGLSAANPDRAEEFEAQRARLAAPDQMGALFQAICLSSPGSPPPAGF